MYAAWDKLFGKLMNRAIELNDSATKELLNKIVMIPEHIKEAVFAKYIDRCILLGAIAFF